MFLGNGRCFCVLWIWSMALANKVKFIDRIQIGRSLQDWHIVKFVYFCCRVSRFWEMGGVFVCWWPWLRSSSSTASRLVDTRFTLGKVYLFLMWSVFFMGNGRWFYLLLDFINGLGQGQIYWLRPDWLLQDWHMVQLVYFWCGVSRFWEVFCPSMNPVDGVDKVQVLKFFFFQVFQPLPWGVREAAQALDLSVLPQVHAHGQNLQVES